MDLQNGLKTAWKMVAINSTHQATRVQPIQRRGTQTTSGSKVCVIL